MGGHWLSLQEGAPGVGGSVQPGCMIPEKQACSLRDEPGCAEEADPASPPSPTGRLAQEAGTVGASCLWAWQAPESGVFAKEQ